MDKQNTSIIQWNCRGVKPNYEEIIKILTDYNPNVVCLQETFLKETDNISFKGYEMYHKINVSAIGNRPSGGNFNTS